MDAVHPLQPQEIFYASPTQTSETLSLSEVAEFTSLIYRCFLMFLFFWRPGEVIAPVSSGMGFGAREQQAKSWLCPSLGDFAVRLPPLSSMVRSQRAGCRLLLGRGVTVALCVRVYLPASPLTAESAGWRSANQEMAAGEWLFGELCLWGGALPFSAHAERAEEAGRGRRG